MKKTNTIKEIYYEPVTVESSGRESESIVGRICEKWALRREWKSEGVDHLRYVKRR